MRKCSFHMDWTTVFVQLVLWGLFFFIFQLTMMGLGHNFFEAFYRLKYVIPPTSVIVGAFFGNYLWLIPRYFLTRRWLAYAGGNMLSFVLLQIIAWQLGTFIYTEKDITDWQFSALPQLPEEFHMAFRLVYILFVFLVILAAVFLRVQQQNRDLRLQAQEQAKEQAQNELDRLKGQLNPHFLFNTLNNISSLSAFDPDATQESISKLSEMLRYVLYDTSAPTVPLQKDLEFLHNYIDLMNIRYEDTLHLNVQLQTSHPDLQIPPMLFISLLENAFKYGATSLHECSIEVKLEEIESSEDKELIFVVRNTLLSEKEMQSKQRGGVGLVNLEKRLELLFPGKHQLVYGMTDDNHYEAKLSLKLK